MYQTTYVNFERKMKYIKVIILFLIQDCGGHQDSRDSGASLSSLRDQWGLCMEVEDMPAKQTVFPEQFLKGRSYGKMNLRSGFIHLGLVLSLLLLTLLAEREHKACYCHTAVNTIIIPRTSREVGIKGRAVYSNL